MKAPSMCPSSDRNIAGYSATTSRIAIFNTESFPCLRAEPSGRDGRRVSWSGCPRDRQCAVEQKTADVSIPVAVTVFPGEIYPCAKELGRACLSQADLLQRGRQRRSLRSVGKAGTLRCRDARGVQITSLICKEPHHEPRKSAAHRQRPHHRGPVARHDDG
jgi:hypothetical protein